MAYNLKNTTTIVEEIQANLSPLQKLIVKLFKINPKPDGYNCLIKTQIKEEESIRLNASILLKKDNDVINGNFKVINAIGEIDKTYTIVNTSKLSFEAIGDLNCIKQLIVISL